MNNLVEILKDIDSVDPYKGVSEEIIIEAENKLGLKFSEQYKEYLAEFGAIDIGTSELNGLGVSSYHNVVDETIAERKIDKEFPKDCYVVENLRYEGMLVISDASNRIYSYHNGTKKSICESFVDYIVMKAK